MTINGWNIEEAGGRQSNVTFGYHAVESHAEWIRGASMPIINTNTIGMKPLKIVIVVKGDGRERIREGVSEILSHLMEPAEIELDGMSHRFVGYLKKHTAAEMSKKRWHTLTLELEGYEIGDDVEVTGNSRIELWNPGTMECPAVLTLQIPSALANITVEGLSEAITMRSAVSGEILIDGENGIATKEGRLMEVNFMEFPKVPLGKVVLTCNSVTTQMTLKFRPRYM